MALTSRKRRLLLGLGAGLGMAIGVYALAGFFLVPYLVQTLLWPLLSEQLGGQIQAERTEFNPFTLAARVGGFSLKNAAGQELASIAETRLDVDAAASLHTRALVGSGRLAQPAVNILIDKQGQPNYAFLLPAEQKPGAPPTNAFPFLLTRLDLTQGRLAFEDRSLGKGFKQVLSPLDASLGNLGTESTAPARFQAKALGENQEQLAAEGDWQLASTASAGEIKLQGLGLAPLAAWLAADLPYTVNSGSLSLKLQYRYAPETGFEIPAAEAQARPFSLSQDGQPFLDAGQITAEGLSYQPKTNRVGLKSASVEKLALKTPTPLIADSVKAQGVGFEAKTQRLAVQSLEAATLKLDQGGQPWLEADSLSARSFAWAAGEGKLALEHLALAGIDLKTPTPMRDREGKPRQFRVESLELGGVAADPAKKTLGVALVHSEHSVLAAWLDGDGAPGFAGLPKTPDAPAGGKAKGDTKTASPTWQVKLGRVELNDNKIFLRDFGYDPPASLRLEPLNLLVKDFDSAAGRPFWLGLNTGLSMNGRIALEGQIRLSPLTANLKAYVDDLSLPPFQPYLNQWTRIRVVKGALNTNADIDYDDGQNQKLRIGGDVAVANFASDDKREGKDFVNWQGLRLNGLIYESAPQRLSIRDIALTQPYIRVILGKDKQFNIAENLSPPETAGVPAKPATPTQPAGPEAPPLAVAVGAFNIHQGSMDFADMTIQPINFAVEIHDLNGNIRSLSSRQDVKSDVLFDGKLNEGSAVKIFGKINPFSPKAFTDIAMAFNGVNLTTLTPYAAKFAGYRIEKGKLDTELRYKLDNGQLTAENKFVLDQLKLGERVDSPDATSLPVGLALSLLKDSDGKIDIDLPISGDLSNPDISIGSLLASAASSLIAKIVSSPFTLVGSLLGSYDSEDLQAVKFAPGAATLSPQEKDELAAVAKVLRERPGLNLEIKGAADLKLDRPALAEQDLTRQLKNAKLIELGRRKGEKAAWDGTTLAEEDYGRLLTNLYRWKHPDAPELQGLRPRASLDASQLANAKRKLLEQWPASEMDLRGLAQARAESIRNYLVKDMGLPGQRIYLLDVQLGGQDAKEIKAMLSLSGS